MGDNLLPTTMYKVVYILRRHKVTMCKECNESRTESEGLHMCLSADDHPLGSSLGLECFRVLWRVSDLGSNIAGISSLQQVGGLVLKESCMEGMGGEGKDEHGSSCADG